MDQQLRDAEIRRVVALALAEFDRRAPEPLPPRLRALEAQRLCELLASLARGRGAAPAFRVVACEEATGSTSRACRCASWSIASTSSTTGGWPVIDYKSGRRFRSTSWAQPAHRRAAAADLCRAGLSRPRRGRRRAGPRDARDPAFLGVAASEGLLPGVKGLEQQRRRYAEDEFPDWAALRALWAERIREVAREVRDGVAAVVFEKAVAISSIAR
jgi:hypothetical protein